MVGTRKNASKAVTQVEGTHVNETQNEVSQHQEQVRREPEVSVRTRHSTNSAVEISRLRNELKHRDEILEQQNEVIRHQGEELNVMKQAMKKAGLLKETFEPKMHTEEEEDEASSKSSPKRPVNKEKNLAVIVDAFKIFKNFKPPTFKGGEDPLACLRWIRKMEQTFSSGDFTEKQRVDYAILQLEGDALEWWDSVAPVLNEASRATLTWPKFVEKLKNRYCNSGAVERAEREFQNLKKEDMTIAKYNVTFTEKLQFARHLCPTERSLVTRYVNGLPFEFRAPVRAKETLDEAMEEARRVEDDISLTKKEAAKTGEKRKFDGPSGKDKYKSFKDEKKKEKIEVKTEYCTPCNNRHTGKCSKETQRCKRCGKIGHLVSECTSKETVCYTCGEMGHISTNCPKKKNDGGFNAKNDKNPKMAKARIFNMITQGQSE